MSNESKLEQQVNEYAALAKENPNIDVTSLMLNAVSQKNNLVSPGVKKWAYIISLGVPPIGLFIAIKYYFFSDEEDAFQVANICIILTFVALGSIWLFGKVFLSSSGTSVEQIQQINPKIIHDTFQ